MRGKSLIILAVAIMLTASMSVAFALAYTINGSGFLPSLSGVPGELANFSLNLKTVGEPTVYERAIIGEAKGNIRIFDHGTGYKINGKMVEFTLSKSHLYYYNFDGVYDPDKKIAGDEKLISGYVGVEGTSHEGYIRIKVEDSLGAVEYDNSGYIVSGDIDTSFTP